MSFRLQPTPVARHRHSVHQLGHERRERRPDLQHGHGRGVPKAMPKAIVDGAARRALWLVVDQRRSEDHSRLTPASHVALTRKANCSGSPALGFPRLSHSLSALTPAR